MTVLEGAAPARSGPKPATEGTKRHGEQFLLYTFVIVPFLAVEGPVIRWVADHRRHHAFSDRQGDPHSPWRYGDTAGALAKGIGYAHVGWLFDIELAVLSFGESWHNMYHADPTAARHGVLRGQLDASARLIWIFERLGWAYDVRRPRPGRLAKLRV
jgi:fatty-acid desaturase